MLDKNSLPALGYKARVNVTGIVDVFPVFKKSKKVVKYSEYKKRLETLELSVSNLQATKNNLEEKLSDVTWDEKSTILHKIDIYNEQLIEESAEIQTLLKNIESLGSELGYRHDRKNAASGYVLNGRSARKIKFQINWLYRKTRDVEAKIRAMHGGKIPREKRKDLPKLLWYTFTLPDKIDRSKYDPQKDDMPVSKQFSRFMETLREYHGVNHYVIVAERQSGMKLSERDKKNGKQPTNKIHFHAIILQESSKRLDIRGVNALWLWHLAKLNYQTFSKSKIKDQQNKLRAKLPRVTRDKMRNNTFMDQLFNPYEYFDSSKYDDRIYTERVKLIDSCMFNPVDCKAIKNIRQLQSYMTKYVTKGVFKKDNDDKDKDQDGNSINDYKIYCRVYRSSKKIGGLTFFKDITHDSGLFNCLEYMVEKFTYGAKKGLKKIFETYIHVIAGEPPFTIYHYRLSERKKWLRMFYSLRRAYVEIVRNQFISKKSLIIKTQGLCM